jgi:hypothetical protein
LRVAERFGDTTRKFDAWRRGGAAAASTLAPVAPVGWRGSNDWIEPGSRTTDPRGLPPVNVP